MGFLRLSWPFYAIVALTLALVLVGWLYKKELHYSAQLEVANSSYQAAIVSYQDEVHKKDQACTITDKTIVELEQEKSSISDKSDVITESLTKLPKKTNNGASNAPQKENENVIQKDVYLPDDGLLSSNLRRLLTESYCIAEPTSHECLSSRQSSDTSM